MDCGYKVSVKEKKFHLSREPLRRFEDVDENFDSIALIDTETNFSDSVMNTLKEIKTQNPTVTPDDIGIILLDLTNEIYALADILEVKIHKEFKWKVNKAYESKAKLPSTILISNRNNVKGLEFPFVICITRKIQSSGGYRNSLYTMLTRSFIKTYLIIPNRDDSGLTPKIKDGLKHILTEKEMVIEEPSESEKEKIRTRFKYETKELSHYDLMMKIFEDLEVDKKHHEKLLNASSEIGMGESDEETLRDFIKDTMKYLSN